jgi:hypothetical protein
MRTLFRCSIITIAVLLLPCASEAGGGHFSHGSAVNALSHNGHRGFEQFPLLFGAWAGNDWAWNNDTAAGWPSVLEGAPTPYPPHATSMIFLWSNTRAYEQNPPYPTSQPDARIVENASPVNADGDRLWVERCQPRIAYDDEGVPRYHYKQDVKGCAAGQSRD